VGFAAAILFGGGILVGLTVAQPSPTAASHPNHALVVPPVIGEPLTVATKSLYQAGLVVNVRAASVPLGGNGPLLVSSQSPKAGTALKKGTNVFIYVAVK
jgi:beta-lactam-binding protein with PASTA domain